MPDQAETPLDTESEISRRFVFWLAFFSAACVVSKVMVSDRAGYMSGVAVLLESCERLAYLLVTVAVACAVIHVIWNFGVSRLTSFRKLSLLELCSLALIFSLFDPGGYLFSSVSHVSNLRLFFVTLIAGYFIQQIWRRLVVKLIPLRAWNYLESVAAFAIVSIFLTR